MRNTDKPVDVEQPATEVMPVGCSGEPLTNKTMSVKFVIMFSVFQVLSVAPKTSANKASDGGSPEGELQQNYFFVFNLAMVKNQKLPEPHLSYLYKQPMFLHLKIGQAI